MTVTSTDSTSAGVSADAIADCFNRLFAGSHRVRLEGGASEPLYLPASGGRPALIRFSRDYPNSALHEAAHWCIAGRDRRQLVDYGYWYQPPPRKPEQQRAFLAVEARVQGLEAIFAEACGSRFRVSVDDVDNADAFEPVLRCAVAVERRRWLERGLSGRAAAFRDALANLAAGCGGRRAADG